MSAWFHRSVRGAAEGRGSASNQQSLPRWPLFVIASPAAVAVWSGWVGLGGLCGFGIVHPLPGIAGSFRLNTAITLPVGVEAYGAYALGAWLAPLPVPAAARKFACWSAVGALTLGMAGQVIYHLLAAAHAHRAPWLVVVLVSCLPVVTLGLATALTHLLRAGTVPDTRADASATRGPEALGKRPDGQHHRDAGTRPVSRPAQGRASRRRRRPDTATAIARLREQDPAMSTAEIARRVGVDPRTVRRYPATSSANGHGAKGEGD